MFTTKQYVDNKVSSYSTNQIQSANTDYTVICQNIGIY